MAKSKESYLTLNDRNTNTDTDNFHKIDDVKIDDIDYHVFLISASNTEGLTATIKNALIPAKKDFVAWLERDKENLNTVYNHILNSFKTDIANRIRPKETVQEMKDKLEKDKKDFAEREKLIAQLEKQQKA